MSVTVTLLTLTPLTPLGYGIAAEIEIKIPVGIKARCTAGERPQQHIITCAKLPLYPVAGKADATSAAVGRVEVGDQGLHRIAIGSQHGVAGHSPSHPA